MSATAQIHLTHLQRLEAEAIHIMREVVSESQNPVMLYSMNRVVHELDFSTVNYRLFDYFCIKTN